MAVETAKGLWNVQTQVVTKDANPAIGATITLPDGVTEILLEIPTLNNASVNVQVLSEDGVTWLTAVCPGDSAVPIADTMAASTGARTWNVSRLALAGRGARVLLGAVQTTASRTFYWMSR